MSGLRGQRRDSVLISVRRAQLHPHELTLRVYGAAGALRVFKAAALVIASASIFLGYRFLLLILTLYST